MGRKRGERGERGEVEQLIFVHKTVSIIWLPSQQHNRSLQPLHLLTLVKE